MKKLLILILLFNCASMKQIVEKPKDLTWKVVSNTHFQKYGSSAFIIISRLYDATADFIIFSPENPRIDKYTWHGWKNGALFFTLAGAGLRGLEVGQNHITFWNAIKRTVKGDAPLCFIVWQYRFHSLKYGNAFDYSMAHNSHRYMIPFLGKDRYVKLNESQMIFVDLNFLIIGIKNLIKY